MATRRSVLSAAAALVPVAACAKVMNWSDQPKPTDPEGVKAAIKRGGSVFWWGVVCLTTDDMSDHEKRAFWERSKAEEFRLSLDRPDEWRLIVVEAKLDE